MNVPMLTTIDNPFDPFTQWDDWFAYDCQKGYYSCAYLARVADPPDDVTPEQLDEIITETIDEICKLNVLGIYVKAYDPRLTKEKKSS